MARQLLQLVVAVIAGMFSAVQAAQVEGLMFRTQFSLVDPNNSTAILAANPEVLRAITDAQQRAKVLPALRKLVDGGGSVELEMSLFMRGLDGPGSSQDLPFWQTKLTSKALTALESMPKTPTIASTFKVKMKFTVSAGPTAVRYLAPQYKADIEWTAPPTGDHMGQWEAPGFVFLSMMGWEGMRVQVELQHVDVMAKEGGMGSSGAFNAGLLAGASMLTGGGLSEADILAVGTKMENADFGGLTGGQELLSSLLGGSYLHVWLLGLNQQYDAFSVPLGDPQAMRMVGQHALYVQAGKDFSGGKPVVVRTASAVNTMWTDLLVDDDAPCEPIVHRMKQLSGLFAKALGKADMAGVVQHVNQFVDLRVQMGQRWLELLGAAMGRLNQLLAPGRVEQGALDESSVDSLGARLEEAGLSTQGLSYVLKVWLKSSSSYQEFGAVRELWNKCSAEQHPEAALRKHDLYISGAAADLVRAARERGDIAVMPLGAGGPGANLIALSSNSAGREYLEQFLREQGIEQLNEPQVAQVVHSTGTMRGWMPFTSAPQGWNATLAVRASDSSLQPAADELHALITESRPAGPVPSVYDAGTGEVTPMNNQ